MPDDEDRARVKHEREMLFTYMQNNIATMVYGPSVKEIGVRHQCNCMLDIDEMNENHGEDIQKKVVPWIIKELDRGLLFNDDQWIMFNDNCNPYDTYLAYRTLFEYQGHYFCLGVESDCHILVDCKTITSDTNTQKCTVCDSEHNIHFCLEYFESIVPVVCKTCDKSCDEECDERCGQRSNKDQVCNRHAKAYYTHRLITMVPEVAERCWKSEWDTK